MRDNDQLILEEKYSSIIEEAPRQRGMIQGAWDKTGGAFLQHPTSMARNELVDIYKKVWNNLENEFEKLKAINPNNQEYSLEFIANFLNNNYPQIDIQKTIQPLADQYDPQGNYLNPINPQTAGNFLYDCLQNHYTSIGGLPSSRTPQNLPQPNPPNQNTTKPNPTKPNPTKGNNKDDDDNDKNKKEGLLKKYGKNIWNVVKTGEDNSEYYTSKGLRNYQSGIRHT